MQTYIQLNENNIVVSVLQSSSLLRYPWILTNLYCSIGDIWTGTVENDQLVNGEFQKPYLTTTKLSHYAFIKRLTLDEHVAIELGMPTDPILRVAKQRFDAAHFVDLNNIETQQLVGYLAQQGYIETSRVPELLTPIDQNDEGAINI